MFWTRRCFGHAHRNVARARAGICERLLNESSGKLKDSVLSYAVESGSLENNDTAVVKERYRLEGVKIWIRKST
jgi:hypothetical protein